MDRFPAEIPPPKLISALGRLNLLPAIVFLPTRRKCDEAALAVAADRSQKAHPERIKERQRIFDEFSAVSPEIASHKHRKMIVHTGVASHHAGHIPAWKLLIEKMMSAGTLNAIFATSTVAAGVDFPARTVVISNADARGNDGWRPLKASELQQMTGRAGRRGKDNVGFVVLAPGQFQNPRKIAELLRAPPDALESQFRATYTSLLNLLDAFGAFAPVREIAEKSFAFRSTRHQIDALEHKRRSIGRLAESTRNKEKLEQIGRDIDFLKEEIWLPFERRAKVLDHFRYLDFAAETVTDSGKWLADVRVDKPLLVGEALSRGLFSKLLTATAAGFMASIAADPDRSYGELHCSHRMLDVIEEFDGVLFDVGSVELKFGIEPVEDINLSAAAAAEAWADGWQWDKLVERTRAEEGDLVRLLSRTGEALLQIGKLRESNKAATDIANAAAEAVLREPVR